MTNKYLEKIANSVASEVVDETPRAAAARKKAFSEGQYGVNQSRRQAWGLGEKNPTTPGLKTLVEAPAGSAKYRPEGVSDSIKRGLTGSTAKKLALVGGAIGAGYAAKQGVNYLRKKNSDNKYLAKAASLIEAEED